MITREQIDLASERLHHEFRSNVDGPATQLVAEVVPGLRAFGQHLRPSSAQRGLHGTAAAMYVLARSSEQSDLDALVGLAGYCERREAIESQIDDDDRVPHRRVLADSNNVIKLSEVLHSLAEAPTSAGLQEYARRLADDLLAGMTPAGAWSYQLKGPTEATALLPTAWAVLALAAHGYKVDQQIAYVEAQLGGKGDRPTDIAVKVFALYVLLRVSPDGDRRKRKVWFREFWEKLSPLLSQDLEVNIEYLSATPSARVFYVRVPWQLYLIACAAELSPYRAFASPQAQTRLAAIVHQVSERGGLLYPHSGDRISSRTNAILYEVLSAIRTSLRIRRLPFSPIYAWNRFGAAANSIFVRRFAQIVAMVVICATLWNWANSKSFDWEQTAPDLATSFLLFLLAGRRYES